MEPHLLKRMVNYAVSHNVQRLRIDVNCDIERLPPCIFSCQTLTSLSLSVNPTTCLRTPLFPNTLNFPALTSLYLRCFAFRGGKDGRDDPFSACDRLNSLIIYHCRVLDAENLCISSTTLVNLTINNDRGYLWCNCKIEIFAPSLCRFAFTGPLQKLYGSNLSSIKQMNIDVDLSWYSPADNPLVLLSWLIELSDIKSSTVSSSTLQGSKGVMGSLESHFILLTTSTKKNKPMEQGGSKGSRNSTFCCHLWSRREPYDSLKKRKKATHLLVLLVVSWLL